MSEGQSQVSAELVGAVHGPSTGGGPSHTGYFRRKWGYPGGPICLSTIGSPPRQYKRRPSRDPGPEGGNLR